MIMTPVTNVILENGLCLSATDNFTPRLKSCPPLPPVVSVIMRRVVPHAYSFHHQYTTVEVWSIRLSGVSTRGYEVFLFFRLIPE